MRWPALTLLGIVSYLFFLLYTLPAQLVVGWVSFDGVTLQGVSGSLWSGDANQVSYQRKPLGRLTWHFLPSRLLLGKLGYEIELKSGGQQLQGNLLMGAGSLSLQNVEALLLAAPLAEWVQQRQLRIGGKVRLQQLDLTLSEGLLTEAQGTVQWLDGSLQSPLNLTIGDLQAELSTDEANGDIQAQIHDLKGSIGLQGEMRLKPDGNFQFDGRLKPGDRADPGLSGALQAIGRKQPDGSIKLKYTGRI